MILYFLVMNSKRCNISYTTGSVSSDILTPRTDLKSEATAEFFNELRGARISGKTQLSSV